MIVPSFGVFAEDETIDLDKIDEIIKKIETYYKFDITREELIDGAYKGILDQLDKYSVYFTEEEYEEFYSNINGTLIGIGIYIEEDNGLIKIITPIEGSPAEKAGLKSGDIITHVDEIAISSVGYQKGIDMIKGEAGTTVKITLNRSGDVLQFDIVRELINIPDVSYEMLEDNIGYIKIVRFGSNVSDEFENALLDLDSKQMKSLVIDLRNNPGGYLSEVTQIAEWFLDEGEDIVFIDYGRHLAKDVEAQLPALNYPLTVLINNGSASASEILAGAIKYNDKGTLIGETTYGKGTVQNLYKLTEDDAMKLTTAEYFSAEKTKVNGLGVEPDIILEEKSIEDVEAIKTFAPMTEESIAHYGITSLNVYGAQQRLKFLGYDVDLNANYDQKTSLAINAFQEKYDLIDKYALYPETSKKLIETVEVYLNEDPQLNRAIELLKEAM